MTRPEDELLASVALLERCLDECSWLPPEQQAYLIEAIEFINRTTAFFRSDGEK